jgi:hypothetical protein
MNIHIQQDSVYIYDDNDNEVASWTESEWLDDPTIITSIFSAIDLAHTDMDKLKELIQK